jgi:two-component system chemotaxis response regulator CheB
MEHRDVIVVGGSAGALQTLQVLLRELPTDLAASLFVVVHRGPNSAGRLADVLDRAGPFPVESARDGVAFEAGRA